MTQPRSAAVLRAILSWAVPLVATVLLSACTAPTAARRASHAGSASTSPAGRGQSGPSGASGASSEDQPHSAGLSAAAIRAVVGTHAKALEACYEHALHDRPKLRGVLVVRVAVNPDGSVTAPTVGDHSKIPASDALARCVLDLVAGWRFPEPAADDDVELLLPFAFKPRPAEVPAADPGHGTGAKSSEVRTPPVSGGR